MISNAANQMHGSPLFASNQILAGPLGIPTVKKSSFAISHGGQINLFLVRLLHSLYC